MGQELLERRGYVRQRTRYFLATTSNGLRVVRGSSSKEYPYACVATARSDWGWVVNLWSSRKDLAQRNANAYNKHYLKEGTTFEVVATTEITPKEARQIKKELNQEILDYREQKKENK
jgi:hypothetical protein